MDALFNDEITSILDNLRQGNIPNEYPSILSSWTDSGISFRFRDIYIREFGFSLISKSWIVALKDNIIKDSKCLEIMAGRGLLAKSLKDIGVDIIATDNLEWQSGKYYPIWESHFTKIEKLDCLEAIEKYGNDVEFIVVSWAPYDESICYDALIMMRKVSPNCKMIFIGEGQGGCTADDEFFEATKYASDKDEQNKLDEINSHYQKFVGIHDCVQIYK